jgi:hypothetical protein
VLQLTAATISACYSYKCGVQNASRDKKKVIDQLIGLQKVLDDVRDLIEPPDASEDTFPPSRLAALVDLLHNPSGLPSCLSELQSLKTKLEPTGQRTDRLRSLIWPLKEAEVKKSLDRLGQFQHLLSLTLNVDQTYVLLLQECIPF